MKRIAVIFLMLLYLTPSIGFSVTVHYCGGKIASVSFFDGKAKCKCGNKKMKKDCCKNEKLTVQLNDEQQKNNTSVFSVQQTKEFHPVIADNNFYSIQNIDYGVDDYNSKHPPDALKPPLYIQHRIFRI